MTDQDRITQFLAGDTFAVVGASRNRAKYGNKVLRAYLQANKRVFPVNPSTSTVEGLDCFIDLKSVPEPIHGISIITPPEVTESVVDDAITAGIQYIWMQPGAESQRAIETARRAGIEVIANGPCILVVMGFRET